MLVTDKVLLSISRSDTSALLHRAIEVLSSFIESKLGLIL